MGKTENRHIVIFVEGDTDKIFFDALISYYRQNSTSINSCEIQNLRGVSRYTSKIIGKLENQICPIATKKGLSVEAVCCSYDTDIFEFSEQPAVDWVKVRREVKRIGINRFCEIQVQSMMEDWLLEDLDGLCSYLKMDKPNSLPGKNGYEKIQKLFRKANRLYLKGTSIEKFIKNLNIRTIRDKRINALVELEKLLNVHIK